MRIPDERVPHRPVGDCGCGADLVEATEVGVARSHQVHDLPEIWVRVGQHDLVLADLLPASVAQRRDKAEALALMHARLSEKIETIRAVAQGGPLVDYGVIHAAKLLSSIDRYLAGDLNLAPALWATVAVDRWLTDQSGQVERLLA